jgi:SAM-dependent methyltransferase
MFMFSARIGEKLSSLHMNLNHFYGENSRIKELKLPSTRLNPRRIIPIQNKYVPLYEVENEGNIHSRKMVVARTHRLCPVCHSTDLRTFFEIYDVPIICSTPWPSRNAALNCPKGNIKLAFCPACSFIMNLDFEPNSLEYTRAYGNPLHFSPYFQGYAQSLAERLVKKYNLYEKDIIEIGCGNGYFLKLLCQLGNNRGVGFDPAYVVSKKNNSFKSQVKFIRDYYSERYSNYQGDLIVCRQTLEHLPNPLEFLKILRRTIGNRENTRLFFEVPNATKIFREMFIWDIIYEHFSHFTSPSLTYTFSVSDFHVNKISKDFKDQFLLTHAQPSNQRSPTPNLEHLSEISRIAHDIESFVTNYQKKVEKCRHKLKKLIDRGQRMVVWGAGSKGVTFLNVLKDLPIEYVIDINPNKQGMYIPGTGQKIVPPELLEEYQPDLIILMNPIYRQEIQELIKKLGLTIKLVNV